MWAHGVRRRFLADPIPKSVRAKRLLAGFNLISLALSVGCLFLTYRIESSMVEGSAVPFRVAVLGRDIAPNEATYRDVDSERAAALARAGAIIGVSLAVLGLALSVGPNWLRLLSSNLLVLLLVLLGMEVLFQAFGIHFPAVVRRGESDRNLWIYDATKGWFHQPLGAGETPVGGPDRGVVRINSLGLRGREISRRKPDGIKRVLVFGDSFTFGVGVDEEHLLTSQLENFLNRRSATATMKS